MSTHTISSEQLTEISDLYNGYEHLPAYSGRGMYGRTCVGFVVGGVNQTLALGAALFEVLGELPDALQDSMGLDTIVYFPHLTVADAA